MAKLSEIFDNVNDEKIRDIDYHAKKILESFIISESNQNTNGNYDKELFESATKMEDLGEALVFLEAVELKANMKLEEAGFINSIGSAINTAKEFVSKKMKSMVSAVSDWFSGNNTIVSTIKKWNVKINVIADKYHNINDSQYYDDDVITEAEVETKPAETKPAETKPAEPIEDNKKFWKIIFNSSGILTDDDGFYAKMGVDKNAFYNNFFKFANTLNYDFVTVLRSSNHKLTSYKPMSDEEVMAYFANMLNILTFVKSKQMVPPGEDIKEFQSKFIIPAIKVTVELNNAINRTTIQPAAKKDTTSTTTGETKPTTNDEATQILTKFSTENKTLASKIDTIANDETKLMIAKTVINKEIDDKLLDAIITDNNFLENNINIPEKLSYIKTLKVGNLTDVEILTITKFIVENEMEDNFHTTKLKDITKVKNALNTSDGLSAILEEIFNDIKL